MREGERESEGERGRDILQLPDYCLHPGGFFVYTSNNQQAVGRWNKLHVKICKSNSLKLIYTLKKFRSLFGDSPPHLLNRFFF